MATNKIAIHGFRKLVRSAKFMFGADVHAFTQAKLALRDEFIKNRNETNPQVLEEMYKGIEEANEVMRFNIVQGSLKEDGNYAVKLTEPSHQVTVETGQCETHGPALEPIDPSIIGDISGVRIEKVSSKKVDKIDYDIELDAHK